MQMSPSRMGPWKVSCGTGEVSCFRSQGAQPDARRSGTDVPHNLEYSLSQVYLFLRAHPHFIGIHKEDSMGLFALIQHGRPVSGGNSLTPGRRELNWSSSRAVPWCGGRWPRPLVPYPWRPWYPCGSSVPPDIHGTICNSSVGGNLLPSPFLNSDSHPKFLRLFQKSLGNRLTPPVPTQSCWVLTYLIR